MKLISPVLLLSLTFLLANCPDYTNGQLVGQTAVRFTGDFMENGINKAVDFGFSEGEKYLSGNTQTIGNYKCPEWAVSTLEVKLLDECISKNYMKEINLIKELFDSLDNTEKRLTTVYIFGGPGSRKSELAQQFGKSVYCKKHGASTVLRLNAKTEDDFRDSLVKSIKKIDSTTGQQSSTEWNIVEIELLMNELKELLTERPGWLLIVDDINDPNIKETKMYTQLPEPGETRWGIGRMIVTSQVRVVESNDTYHKIITANLPQDPTESCKLGTDDTKHSQDFDDFKAFIGFTVVNRKTISKYTIQGFLKMRGHEEVSYTKKIFDAFSKFYLKKKRHFCIEPETGSDFRKYLEQNMTDDSLQSILRNISHFLVVKLQRVGFQGESAELYTDLVQNLPTRCPHIYCLTSPESEHFSTTLTFIGHALKAKNHLNKLGDASKCFSKMNSFFQLDSPNKVSARVRFFGYQVLIICVATFEEHSLVMTELLELIKEVAPEQPELTKTPLAWFLLNADEILKNELMFDMLFLQIFPQYLKYFNDASQLRNMCASLCNVTKILIPHLEEEARTRCNKHFVETDPLNSPVKLGRIYRLRQSSSEQVFSIANPYGACYLAKNNRRFLDNFSNRMPEFYIDYDKRVGLKKIIIASQKYETVLRLWISVLEIQKETIPNRNGITCLTCQCTKKMLKSSLERPTSITPTKVVKMYNDIQPVVKIFQEKVLSFVNRICNGFQELYRGKANLYKLIPTMQGLLISDEMKEFSGVLGEIFGNTVPFFRNLFKHIPDTPVFDVMTGKQILAPFVSLHD